MHLKGTALHKIVKILLTSSNLFIYYRQCNTVPTSFCSQAVLFFTRSLQSGVNTFQTAGLTSNSLINAYIS